MGWDERMILIRCFSSEHSCFWNTAICFQFLTKVFQLVQYKIRDTNAFLTFVDQVASSGGTITPTKPCKEPHSTRDPVLWQTRMVCYSQLDKVGPISPTPWQISLEQKHEKGTGQVRGYWTEDQVRGNSGTRPSSQTSLNIPPHSTPTWAGCALTRTSFPS